VHPPASVEVRERLVPSGTPAAPARSRGPWRRAGLAAGGVLGFSPATRRSRAPDPLRRHASPLLLRIFRSFRPKAMLSRATCAGRAHSLEIIAMSLSFGGRRFTTSPPIFTVPLVIGSRPADHPQGVVFPQPDGPTKDDELAASPILRSSSETREVPSSRPSSGA